MFHCREEELNAMNRRYEKGRFECVVIYGRQRVGKTALINEFCKDKPTIFFSALNASSQENLFNTSRYLFEKPENLLKQELRELSVYNSVIAAIAGLCFRGWRLPEMRSCAVSG
ncbi:MAG: ATP-binding protein [Lachnospiraceae bacterium]|nr:ATP-binding protein [Lachnospiraceae bacterium]